MNSDRIKSVPPKEGALQDSVNIKDMLMISFENRFWFMLSVIIMVTIGTLYIMSRSNIYSRTAIVLVEEEGRGGGVSEAAAFQELFSMGGGSVYNAIGLFKSNRLMYDVVERLDLEVEYRLRKGIRYDDLYSSSPIKVRFSKIVRAQRVSFTVRLLDDEELYISELKFYMGGGDDLLVEFDDCTLALGETMSTEFGDFVVTPTIFYNSDYLNRAILVERSDPKMVGQLYSRRLNVGLVDKLASLITISIDDESIRRAEDIINTLIEVYSDDAINDKNLILSNTSKFIDERLSIIDADLKAVDSEIENFKRLNNLTDISSDGTMHLERVSHIDQVNLDLKNQLSVAQYMKSYLEDESNAAGLIPFNVGIVDGALSSQIAEYNSIMNSYNRALLNSSAQNPIVNDYRRVLVEMRSSILMSVNNLIDLLEL